MTSFAELYELDIRFRKFVDNKVDARVAQEGICSKALRIENGQLKDVIQGQKAEIKALKKASLQHWRGVR